VIDKGKPTLRTDFNSASDGRTLFATADLKESLSLPTEGDVVRLVDGDRNECLGVVEAAYGDDLFQVAPIWDSWEDGDRVETTGAAFDLMETLRQAVEASRSETSATKVENFKVQRVA
jgi:hypothetical protein